MTKLFSLKLNDLWKGFIVAVLTAPLTIIYESLQAGSLNFDWPTIGKAALAAACAYLIKNFLTGTQGKMLTNK